MEKMREEEEEVIVEVDGDGNAWWDGSGASGVTG